MGSPGRRPFLPGPMTPYPTFNSPKMVWRDRKGFNSTKTKQNFCVMIHETEIGVKTQIIDDIFQLSGNVKL